MSTFPKVKGLNGYDYYLYQGFWCGPFLLEALMSVLEHFNPQSTDIYICREAKDAFVSLWSFHAMLHRLENVDPLPLEEAFELFCNGIANYGPYWDHVLGQGGARKNVKKIDDGDHISIIRDITWSTFIIIIIIDAILKQLKILKN